MKITKNTRWFVFAGVWLQSLFTSATAFFSLFALPLTQKFGWTMSDFALAYTFYMIVYCSVGFLGGSIAEKFKPRTAIYLGLILFAGGWFLTGKVTTITGLYLTYGLMAGAGGGLIYPACLPTALKWFPDKAGSISGLTQAGASFGPFIFSPIAALLIESYGAQAACQILSVIFLVGVGLVAWMIVPCPEGWTPEGWTPKADQVNLLNKKSYSTKEMIKTPLFWVMLIMFIFANASGTMMVSATSPIAQKQIGLTSIEAAFCVSIMTLSNMVGRISFGVIYDKLKGWNSLILCLAITSVSMLLLMKADSYAFFVASIVLVGFSFGGLLVVFAPMVRQLFGSKYYNRNYGLIFIGYGVGAFVGPRLSAGFLDLTGQYYLGFASSAALALAAIGLVLWAKKLSSDLERGENNV